ncbi:MAG TPA: hypothetical protein VN841_05035 [Bryobacteraceae bacterium]|nr:hypothetical protein [Bryobacteraceae bacterium]
MQPSTPLKATPPKVIGVEVVTAQPTEADSAAIKHLSAEAGRLLPQVAYVVKVRFRTKPPVSSQGWALYVNDFRIPKYWEYEHGIYFKVFDAQFFADHKGHKLRFSHNGNDFIDTGTKLPAPPPAAAKSKRNAVRLPLQAELLR